MAQKSSGIVVVVKDNGGINNVIPVAKKLKPTPSIPVNIVTNGIASTELPKNYPNIKFTPVQNVKEALEIFPYPSLLITSMCSEGGVGRDLVPLLKGSCPIIAVQDYWGVRLMDEWSDQKYRPDYITVHDQLGANMVKKAWPEFPKDNIIRTGFPMFDSYSDITLEYETRARNEILAKLGVNPRSFIIFFPCGVLTGASEELNEILTAVEECKRLTGLSSKDLYVIPRVHPRLDEVAPNEFEPWNNLLDEFEKKFIGTAITDPAVVRADIKVLLLASDVVVSDYSATLMEAGLVGSVLNGKANISVCYPPTIANEFRKEFGKLMTEPPFVTLGCSDNATNVQDLGLWLTSSLEGHNVNRLNLKQKQHFKVDGKNALRVAKLIATLI